MGSLIESRKEELEKVRRLPVETPVLAIIKQKIGWFFMTVRTRGIIAGLGLIKKNIKMAANYLFGTFRRRKNKNDPYSIPDSYIREAEDFADSINGDDRPIRVLDLCYYMICPPTSGGMLRILAPLLKMDPADGILFSMVFTTYSEDYAKECKKYLDSIPVVEFSKGVVSYKYKNPLGEVPKNIPKDVWETVSAELINYLKELLSRVRYDVIQVEHSQFAWLVPFLREYSPESRIVLDAHNIEYRIYETWLPYASDEDRDDIENKYHLLRNWEQKVWPWFDAAFSVSSEEQRILQESGIPRTYLVPTGGGIDPGKYAPDADNERPMDILYIGSMNWYANVHGLIWFINDVFPIIKQRRPGTIFNIVGSGEPSGKLLEATKHDKNIRFWGFQEDDVGFFHKAKVFVVPLWIGAGARVKVITAWAAKIPVVSTFFGAEGSRTDNLNNIVMTDDPAEFAESVLRILDDQDHARTIADNAYRTFLDNYTVDKCTEILADSYREMADKDQD